MFALSFSNSGYLPNLFWLLNIWRSGAAVIPAESFLSGARYRNIDSYTAAWILSWRKFRSLYTIRSSCSYSTSWASGIRKQILDQFEIPLVIVVLCVSKKPTLATRLFSYRLFYTLYWKSLSSRWLTWEVYLCDSPLSRSCLLSRLLCISIWLVDILLLVPRFTIFRLIPPFLLDDSEF